MTVDRPAPLVPAEVDLRDFAFMPLDVLRLRDSDLACVEDAEVFRCAVLSWCVSWHQVPAASLPDDDGLLARLLGFGRDVRGWKKVRSAGGMRGWVLCSDGRLYHEVVAEKARDAWNGKLAQRWRTEAARVKKHNQRHKLDGAAAVSMPEFDEWKALGCPQGQTLHVPGTPDSGPRDTGDSVPRETASKGQGEGQGEGQGQLLEREGAPKPRPSRKAPDSFLVEADLQQWARENVPGVDIRTETAKFRDHTFKTAHSDWPGAWRNWMRRAFESAGPARRGVSGAQARLPALGAEEVL